MPPCLTESVGVVPRLFICSVRTRSSQTAYYVDPDCVYLCSCKVGVIPETIRAIKSVGYGRRNTPHSRGCTKPSIYRTCIRYHATAVNCSQRSRCRVVITADRGSWALRCHVERRTKRSLYAIMGARRFGISAFWVGQFARPVLWANLLPGHAGYSACHVARRFATTATSARNLSGSPVHST